MNHMHILQIAEINTSGYIVIPDFGGELYTGLDDQGFLWMCGHAWLLLHHKRAEKTHHT